MARYSGIAEAARPNDIGGLGISNPQIDAIAISAKLVLAPAQGSQEWAIMLTRIGGGVKSRSKHGPWKGLTTMDKLMAPS